VKTAGVSLVGPRHELRTANLCCRMPSQPVGSKEINYLMSEATPTPDNEDVPSLEELTDSEAAELLTEHEIEMPDGECDSLAQVATDIVVAHNEIEAYKTGALSISQSIDEAIIEHEDAGNDEVVDVLKELKSTAFGIYLRIKRGDEELMGDREGKYSGYFATEE